MDYARTPSLLIVSESGGAGEIAEATGLRVLATVPVEAAAGEMAARAFDGLLVEATEAGPALSALLGRIGAEELPAVLALSPMLLDLAWSLAPNAVMLSDPAPRELAAALERLLAPVDASVAERRDHPGELLRLSAEVGRIAQTLAELSIDPTPAATAPDAAHLRAILRARRLRDRFFDAALFADPAWDMMLDLFAAYLEGKQVAVSSLCIAAAVPTTTALRWIRGLTDAGVFVRIADPGDGRRFFIALADPVRDSLSAYFAELQRQGLPGA